MEQEAEEKLYVRHEEKYRHTIDVGRYELSLDILEEDLDLAREKLVFMAVACVSWVNSFCTECHFEEIHVSGCMQQPLLGLKPAGLMLP